jgi:hypothetical protein
MFKFSHSSKIYASVSWKYSRLTAPRPDISEIWASATEAEVATELESPSDQRVLAIASALQRGVFISRYFSCVYVWGVNYIYKFACINVCVNVCMCVLFSHESAARQTVRVSERNVHVFCSSLCQGMCVCVTRWCFCLKNDDHYKKLNLSIR